MYKAKTWSIDPGNKKTLARHILSYVSLRVRGKQYEIFWKLIKPKSSDRILDVGVSPDETTLIDTNFFEKKYPYTKNLTAASVENCKNLFRKKYPDARFIQINQNSRLPFKNKSFDIVVSWATLEHVGSRQNQKFFLKEIFRVGKKIFITTPDKDCFYEPHSGLFFVHRLPYRHFSYICKRLGKDFWADIQNLNPLRKKDLQSILPTKNKIKIIIYRSFGIIRSHLLTIKID